MPLPKNLPRSAQSAKTAPPPAAKNEGGKVLANRYRVEDKLGSGAFGSCFLVTDLKAIGNERWGPCVAVRVASLFRIVHAPRMISNRATVH